MFADTLPVPEHTGPFAFFKRHWRGDYPLGRSYWVHTVLLSSVAPLFGLALVRSLAERAQFRHSSLAVLLTLAMSYVVWLWAARGTWASATKHPSRGGTHGWAVVAKVMLCLALVKLILDVRENAPMLKAHWQVAFGDKYGQKATIQLRAGGQSLLLAGGIDEGTAQQLDDALRANPGVRTVVFASPGGWIREGERLADIIRRRGLDTYVEGTCASA